MRPGTRRISARRSCRPRISRSPERRLHLLDARRLLRVVQGTPAKDEATRKRTIDIINVSGNAALAKATLDHGATIFTDYFVLLKVDGEWRIANKVYSGQPRGG